MAITDIVTFAPIIASQVRAAFLSSLEPITLTASGDNTTITETVSL